MNKDEMKVIERPVSTRIPNIILMKVDPPLPYLEGQKKFYDKNETIVMYKDIPQRNGDILRIVQEKPLGAGYVGDCSNGEAHSLFWENEGWKRQDVVDAEDQKARAEALRLAEIEKREAELAKREAEMNAKAKVSVKGDK